MTSKGRLKSMSGEGTSKKTLDLRVEELEKRIQSISQQVVNSETKLAQFHATLQEAVRALNNLTLVLSCVERHLDQTVGEDWDAGVRKEAEKRAELLRRRREITVRAQRERKELKLDERGDLARELWGIARELDLRAKDAAGVVALHLQNGDVDSSLDVIEEIRRDGVEISEEVEGIVNQLIARCIEVARKTGNDLLVARAGKLAKIPEGVSEILTP